MFKKIIIGLAILLILMMGIIAFLFFTNNKKRPIGIAGDKAEIVAQKLSRAINKQAWDTTRFVQWTFRGEHDYFWDRQLKLVEVLWDENRVLLDIDNQTGLTYIGNSEISDSEKKEDLLKTAHAHFINDAFWLNAPSMIYNPDVTRSYVELKDGHDGLMVTYNSGGVTPGDSYLWKLNDEGLPTSYQMWVSIIPVGGLEFSWDDWTTLSSGARVAQYHTSKLLDIAITNLKDGQHLGVFNRTENPFSKLNVKKK